MQPLLETAVPHVLIILDCCFAATAARDTTEGTTKEILAACGRESPTLDVGQRSFTSALIEEMQAFDGAPFTATMLHSRLVTMRWRLAFTPIYALLSERGGNSITLCPLSDVGVSDIQDAQLLVELEATDNPQEGQTSMIADNSPSLQTSQKQTVDSRVLLSVSVVQDAIHDIPHWVSWLTTAAPWDVTKVDVRVESIFRSHSTLMIVSIPTHAWSRLPERPAYRFVGFIQSGNLFELQTSSEAQSTHHRHKSQGTDVVPLPATKMPHHSPWFLDLDLLAAPLGLEKSPKSNDQPAQWSSEDDELLMEARREGLENAESMDAINIGKLSKAYVDSREHMWKVLADKVGEDWQVVEAQVGGFSVKYI